MNIEFKNKRRSTELIPNNNSKKIAGPSNSAIAQMTAPNATQQNVAQHNDNYRYFDDNISQYFHTQTLRKMDEVVNAVTKPKCSLIAPQKSETRLGHCFGFSQYLTDSDSDEDDPVMPGQRYIPPPSQVLGTQSNSIADEVMDAANISDSAMFAIPAVPDLPAPILDTSMNDLNTAQFLLDDGNDDVFESSQFLNDVKSFVANASVSDNFDDPNWSLTLTSSELGQLCTQNFVVLKSNKTMNEYLQLQRSMEMENEENINQDDFNFDLLNQSTQFHRNVEDTFNECERTIRGLDEFERSEMDVGEIRQETDHNAEDINLSDFREEFDKTYLGNGNQFKPNGEAITASKPAKLLPVPASNFCNLGPFFGLPNRVKSLIREFKGIDDLYDWQKECLQLPAIERRQNLVYALPTSGGKTLVSEILILREIICRQRNCLFILPYVSIVQEKVWALSPFAVQLDFLIEEYAAGKGCLPPKKRRQKRSVYIATIEKGLALFDSLIESDRANEIGLIVVDELHIIGEGGRGAVLESLLTKVQYIKAGIQIVGMSATIGNLNELATFMNADIYHKDFRPVELREHVKSGSEILEIKKNAPTIESAFEMVRTVNFSYTEDILKMDPDHITGLVTEIIPNDSCLVFCATKKNCESLATLICGILSRKYLDHKPDEKQGLIKAIEIDTGTGICPILAKTLPFGVAYHHSGLTVDERRHLENAFRDNVICVICCTSTLAAGVNLPAKRVIIRSPYVGRDFITLSRYKQMVGRAGRAGFGESGDSILICSERDNIRVMELLCSPMEEVASQMHLDEARALRALFLSAVGLGIATCCKDLQKLAATTLMAVQAERLEISSKQLTKEVITKLVMNKTLKVKVQAPKAAQRSNETTQIEHVQLVSQDESSRDGSFDSKKSPKDVVLTPSRQLEVSRLGKASFKSGIDLDKSEIVLADLMKAQESLVLSDHLHLLYLVTPCDAIDIIRPDKRIFYAKYTNLLPQHLHTAKVIGITESVAQKMASGSSLKIEHQRIVNKFFMTLMLYDLWQMKTPSEVAASFQIDRGLVQNLMGSASMNSSLILKFCEEIDELWCFKELLLNLTHRLTYCCTLELLPLMQLPCVKLARAKQLYNAGFRKLEDIASVSARELASKIEYLHMKIAKQLISAAKVLLIERVETLREEAQDCLDVLAKRHA